MTPEAEEAPRPAPLSATSAVYALDVITIAWERIHLMIRLRLKPTVGGARAISPTPVSFVLTDGAQVFDLAFTGEGEGTYAIHVNVTNFHQRHAVPDGTWRIQAVIDHRPGPIASYDGTTLDPLDEASRVFLYDKNRAAMTVSYGINENADDPTRLDFLVQTYQFHRSPPPAGRTTILARVKAKLLGNRAKQAYARMIYNFVVRLVGPRPGRILFASDQQPSMEGNLRRVHERMTERGLDARFDMRTSFRLPATTGWVTTTRILCLLATSEIVLLDDYFGLLNTVTIDSRSRVIQLWHAGIGFKSVGYSRFGRSDSPKLSQPHRQYSYAICGSEHLRPVYAEAFGIEESAVIPTGLPRIDWFLDEKRTASFTETFFDQHPHLRGKRIILFAPTFRGASYHEASYDYGLIDFVALYEACPADTVVLFRMHHFVKDPIDIPEKYRDRFFDFTGFADGLGLLHVTDLLITDYSSIIYEFALLNRPMLFFAPDKTVYGATRGFHRDYERTAPGRVCESFDEVVSAIEQGDFDQEKLNRFRDQNFDRIDTGAADRVIDWLILDKERGFATSDGG
ncbi:CDP-glycerol glycerophosphotransferase family protein [Microbacterium horticulturae]|uniref:CDP-glycerol glycerophosphotransferase family protein n=1 Tax=Microbacterium horticulturae TaxID=3028316 RepID=A0ABY8BVH0_9MICO|nr:CDP-glycerol glycerophosphotransferase family protein [Microbacterium sp. KACC 23027]WEG07895.1 CDP-glycerol glycerophosphotransferase family protein [Microbacterium sp. KACC 23027]